MSCGSSSRSRWTSSPSLKVIERGFVLQKEILKKIEEKLGIENIKYDEPMSKHTSFKVGGNADIFMTIHSAEEMLEILKINKGKLPITVVGNGTNLLVKDIGIRGIVVKYIDNKIEEVLKNEETIENLSMPKEDTTIGGINAKSLNNKKVLKVSAGISNAKLAMYLLKNNLSGFEFAAGIPRNTRWSSLYECWSFWRRNKRYSKKCNLS